MKSKTLNRIGFISNNVIRQLLVSAFNVVIPFLVIHFGSKEIWGKFVPMLLFSLLAIQVINWGNKEYQLRQFSRFPNKIGVDYSTILATRLPLVFGFGIIGFFMFPILQAGFILLWVLGRFLIHSAEALVIFEKEFNTSIVIESGSFFVFCLSFFYLRSSLGLFPLLVLYSLYQLIKGLGYFFFFRNYLITNISFDIAFYKSAFPFFLLSILGFLASKVDVYIIANLGNKITTADYQIINSLLVFIMSLSAFMYVPFTKNIYRNTDSVIGKTGRLLLLSGLLIVPAGLISVYVILKYYLHLNLPLIFYPIAFAYVFPAFAYGIDVVNLFRLQKEKTVVGFLFIGAVANAALSALFLYNGFGITGALAGSAIAQIIVLILFKWKST
jgi:hypothetical protein